MCHAQSYFMPMHLQENIRSQGMFQNILRQRGFILRVAGLAACVPLLMGVGSGLPDIRSFNTGNSFVGSKGSESPLDPDKVAARARALVEGDSNSLEATGEIAVQTNALRSIDGKLENVAPLRYFGSPIDLAKATECLAAAAYYEAGDDRAGQQAVIQVVLNRTRHPAYPNTVCGVVLQGSERRTGCQFTFTCDGSLARRPSASAWSRARATAAAALSGYVDKSVGSSTHYHADYVLPYWSHNLQKVAVVGPHIFYRFPGTVGSGRALMKSVVGEEVLGSKFAALSAEAVRLSALPVDLSASEDPIEEGYVNTSTVAELPSLSRNPDYTSAMHMASDSNLSRAGRWAVDSLGKCSGKSDCQMVIYPTQGDVDQAFATAPSDRVKPLFLFVRDSASKSQVALWNCDLVDRPAASDCLPDDRASLSRLLRKRN